MKLKGVISEWDPRNNFCFVRPNAPQAPTVYANFRDFTHEVFAATVGSPVEFDVKRVDGKATAVGVRML